MSAMDNGILISGVGAGEPKTKNKKLKVQDVHEVSVSLVEPVMVMQSYPPLAASPLAVPAVPVVPAVPLVASPLVASPLVVSAPLSASSTSLRYLYATPRDINAPAARAAPAAFDEYIEVANTAPLAPLAPAPLAPAPLAPVPLAAIVVKKVSKDDDLVHPLAWLYHMVKGWFRKSKPIISSSPLNMKSNIIRV